MAALEEIGEIIGEAEEGIEAEGAEAEGLGEEASEELAAEVNEATESVGVLRQCVNTLKALDLPQVVKTVAKFIAKNAAIGAILYGVNVGLKKLFEKSGGGAHRQEIEQKQKKVKALAQLTKDVASALNKLSKWTKDKEEVTVDIGDGITVPLPDLLTKFMKPMEKHVEEAYAMSKQLMKKDDGGKSTFVVPTTDQVDKLIKSSESIASTLQEIIKFVDDKKEKIPDLGTLPIEKNDVDNIIADLVNIKRLPYA